MRKVLPWLGAALLVLVAGAMGAAWWFLSRIDARAEIVQRVTAATGRAFTLSGPVSVSFWPAIGFRGEGAALANVPGGVAPHLLEAKAIVVGVALRPLLDHRLEVTRFVLSQPKLSLEVDADGRPNWILKPAPSAPSQRPAGPAQPVTDLKLSADIEDGRVSYANVKTHSAYELGNMNLKVAMAGLDGALSVKGDAAYRDKPVDLDITLGRMRALMTGRSTPLTVQLDMDVLKARLVGAFDVATGDLAGDVTATGPSLRNLAAWAGAPFGPGYGLETFALSGRLDVGPRRYAFENAGLQIDDIKARGDFLIESGRRAPFLSGRIEIVDEGFDPLAGASVAGRPVAQRMTVNLNPYLQGARAATAGESVEVAALQPVDVSGPAGWSEARMNFAWLKALNTNLELTTGPLRYQNILVDKVELSLTVLDGYLTATMPRMELYGGIGSSRMELDARTPQIVVRNEIAVQDVRARDFFRDTVGFQNLEGTAKLEWGFSSRGETQKDLMTSLAGAGSVQVRDGVLNGIDVGGLSRTIRNAMRRELVSTGAKTPFTNLAASLRAIDGVVATQDLSLTAKDFRFGAIGVIDAGRRSIDLRLTPRFGGLAVPFRMSGPWSGIRYENDFLGRSRVEVEARARAVFARAPRR